MVLAIESKKRKFIRILDSTFPTEDNSGSIKKPPKKPRIGIPDSGLSSVATFAPYDRQQFLRRLETFRSIRRWDIKGEDLQDINEVQWAKRGWICDEDSKNEVKCRQCGARIVVDVPDEPFYMEEESEDQRKSPAGDHAAAHEIANNAQESRPQLTKKYKDLIVEGHEDTCPWKAQGCDAAIQRLAFGNREKSIQALRERYFSLIDLAENLPDPQAIVQPSDFDSKGLLETLPKEFFDSDVSEADLTKALRINDRSSTNDSITVNNEALILASYGWEGMAEDGGGLAICGACFRRIGFWLCKEPGQLNPFDRHAYYCPWINPNTQTGRFTNNPAGEHLSGVELLQKSLIDRRQRQHLLPNTPPKGTRQSSPSGSYADSAVTALTLQTLAGYGIPIPEPQPNESDNATTKEYTRKYEARQRLVAQQVKELAEDLAAFSNKEPGESVSDLDPEDSASGEELIQEIKIRRAEQLLLETGARLEAIDDFIKSLRKKSKADAEKQQRQKLAERQASDKALFSRLRKIREKFNVMSRKGKNAAQ